MPWAGVILWRPCRITSGARVFCAVFDEKRQDAELPKGDFQPLRRESSGCADVSLFATARWKLWEEAGWWLSYREHYWWVDNRTGRRLLGRMAARGWLRNVHPPTTAASALRGGG